MRVSRVSKEHIVGRAREAFLTQGFRAVRVEDVARALGMSKKTFYRHFASKDELVRAVVLGFAEDMFASLAELVDAEMPVLRKIDALIEALSSRLRVLPPGALHELARLYPHVVDEVLARRRRFLVRYFGMIEEGQRRGEIRADFDAQALTQAVLAVVETIANPAFMERTGLQPLDAVRLVRAFLVGGLSAKSQEVLR